MKAKTIIIIIAVIIIGLDVIALGYLLGTGKFFPVPTPTPTATFTPSPSPTTAETPTLAATLTPTVATSSENISVTMPKPYDEVVSPLHVEGTARVFENLVSIRLKNSAGQIIASATANASAPDVGQFGPYTADLTFAPQTGTGTLEVLSFSAIDGSEINLVSIPITFK